MSYNPNIPIITDPILQSSSQIKANFKAINAAFADNHVGLTRDDEFSGMHTALTLQPQVSDPATSSTQIAIYNKLVGGIPEMFFRPRTNQTPIQMTYESLVTGLQSTNPDVYFIDQYSFVAGPFIIYGGKITNPTQGQTVTLTPGTTLIFVDLIVSNTNILPTNIKMAIPTNISGTSFDIRYQSTISANFDVYYYAVGL